MPRFLRRLKALLTRRSFEHDVEREMSFHMDMAAAAREKAGESANDAARHARQDFGDPVRVREGIHDARGLSAWDALRQDARFAVRTLRRSPGFTLAAMLVLGLGIGANTAVFSVINGVLLKPLPFRAGHELMLVQHAAPAANVPNALVSINELYAYRERLKSVTDLVEYHSMSFTLLNEGDPDRVDTGVVSANFFDMLGITPAKGRTFRQGEDALGSEPVLVLSHRYWQQKFGGRDDVVGKVVQMNNRPHQIVGVLPDFPEYPRANDVYMPTSACPFRSGAEQNMAQNFRSFAALAVFGRIAPGATPESASAEIATVAQDYATTYPQNYQGLRGFTGGVRPLDDTLTSPARPMLWTLVGTTLLVLVLACANVANLSLGRTLRRQRELALRAALGAGRGRLVRQLLTESVIVALAGGVIGLGVAYATVGMLSEFAGRFTPRTGQINIDGGVMLFALAASILTGIIFGTAPAFAARRSVVTTIREGSQQSGESGGRQRLRSALVVAQVAVSFMLLVGAALLIRSFSQLSSVPIGFSADRVMTAAIFGNFTRMNTNADQLRINVGILDELRASRGVVSAAVTNVAPFTATQPTAPPIEIEGIPPPPGRSWLANASVTSEDYFKTLGVPILNGREFTMSDDAQAPPVAVINGSMAAYWNGVNPIGTRFRRPGNANSPWLTVVGVAADFRMYNVDQDVPAMFHVPFRWAVVTFGAGAGRLLVRSNGDPQELAPVMRDAVHKVDPQIPVEDVQTLAELKTGLLQVPGLTAALLTVFAAVALLVTLAGLAGVIATSVSQRTREFGVRMALGASRGSVLALVLRQAVLLVVVGLVLGTVGAVAFSRLLQDYLFATTPHDVLSYAAVAVLFLLAAVAATFAPARRATSIEPLRALRE